MYFILNSYTRYNNYIRNNRKDYNKIFFNVKFEALIVKRNRLVEATYKKSKEIR